MATPAQVLNTAPEPATRKFFCAAPRVLGSYAVPVASARPATATRRFAKTAGFCTDAGVALTIFAPVGASRTMDRLFAIGAPRKVAVRQVVSAPAESGFALRAPRTRAALAASLRQLLSANARVVQKLTATELALRETASGAIGAAKALVIPVASGAINGMWESVPIAVTIDAVPARRRRMMRITVYGRSQVFDDVE